MRKNLLRFGLIVAALLVAFLSVHAYLPTVPTGQWAQASNLTQAHDDAASVLLNSGAVLVIGGNDGNGPSTAVERFGTDGSVAQVVPMSEPRQRHTATVLQDGRVLVVGGDTGSGATNSLEVFDPRSNTWSNAGTLSSARSRHTATLLADGRVLIAGGENNGAPVASLEIFDPADSSVSVVASLNNARTNHAATLLGDGRVLIAGGSSTDSSGNSVSLASVEIFDPQSGSVTEAASMNVPRANLSATTVLDGFVVVAGGNNASNDLASIEVYDPANNAWTTSQAQLATPRSQHTAALLPNNNGVLIWGGSSNETAVQSAETYRPWSDSVFSAGSQNAAHLLGTGTPLTVEGLYFAAAGSAAGNTELYRFATIKTDKVDYSPGTPVVMTGTGFTPGETVQLSLKEDDGDPTTEITVTADSNGKIAYQEFAPDVNDVGTHFHLLAVGQSSGQEAQTTFQDGNVNVFSAPSGITFTLNFSSFNTTDCSGSSTPGTQAIAPDQQGNNGNVGVGNSDSVRLDAPLLSDQGATFVDWNWGTLSHETAVKTGRSVCIQNTGGSKTSVDNGVFTATYSNTTVAPTIASVSPTSGNVGQTITTVTLTGTGLTKNTQVSFGSGITVGTVTANSNNTQLTFSLTVSSTAIPGTRNVTVTNQAGSGGGGGTATLSNGFAVNALTPTITSLTPTSTAAGSAAQTLTITGTNFVPASTITYNGVAHAVTSQTSTQLQIQLSAADQATVGSYPVQVTNPVNVTSNTVNFTVNNPAPTLTSISPASRNLGQTLDVVLTGTKFTSAATVSFSGTGITVNMPLTISSTSITANITIANNASTGARNVSVTNPTPGGGTATLTNAFTINNPTTTTTVTATSATPTYGDSDTFTATVTSAAGTPTGSVKFYDAAAAATCSAPGSSVVGTQSLDANGKAQTSTSSLAAGSHTILACYTPTGIYLASNGMTSVTVGKASATVTVTGYGVTYDGNEHTATGTVTGVGGVSLSGLDLSSTKHTTAGSYNDSWTFTDTTGNYSNATGTVADHIGKANATISVSGYNTTYDGAPHTATATATGVKGESLLSGVNLSGTTHTNAGTYNDSWNFTDVTGNYNPSSGSVTDSIAKAKISVTAGGYAGIYDGKTHELNACSVTGTFSGGLTCSNNPANAGPNAGTVSVIPVFTADANNFDVTATNGSIVISPASLTVTADPQSMSFGGTTPNFTASYTGLVNNETADVITTKPSFVVMSNDAPPTVVSDVQSLKVGGYPIVPSGAAAPNYAITYANGTLTVNKAQITGKIVVTPEDPATVAYGQTVTAKVYLDQYSLGGINVLRSHADPQDSTKQLPPSLTVWLVPASGGPADAVKFNSGTAVPTYDNTTETTGSNKTGWTATISGKAPAPGNYKAVIYGDDPGDHTLSNLHLDDAGYFYTDLDDMQYPTLTSNQLDVVKAALTITANSTTKKYGQMITFTGTEFTTSALVNSDSVTKVTLTSTGAVATAAVNGSPYKIVASDAQGTGLENYAIDYVDGKLNVDKADASITVTGYKLTYDGNAHTATATITGVNNETLNLDLSGTAHTNAGTYTDDWSFTDPNGNYNPQTGKVTDVINKADATISVTGYHDSYNGQSHTATGSATGVDGKPLSGLDLDATTHSHAGTYTDTWTFTDTTGNYNNASGSVSDKIDPAKVTATAGSYSGTYDTQPHPPTACALGGSYRGSLVCANNPSLVGPDVSSGAVAPVLTGDDLSNFEVTSTPGAFAISQAPLMITAEDKSMTFGDDAPAFTVTYDGFLGTDDATKSLSAQPTFKVYTDNTLGTAVTDFNKLKAGSYPIVPGDTTSHNYAITFKNGKLTVNKAAITGKVVLSSEDPATVAYGQPLSATVYLDQFKIGGVDVLQSHADPDNPDKQLPPSMTIWLVPAGGTVADAVQFGSATAQPTYDNTTATSGTKKTGWTATVNSKAPVPGNYNAFVYGDDPGDKSLSNAHLDDAGYFYTDLDDMQYPKLTSKQLDVVPASLTITASNRTKTYGDTVTFAGTEFTVDGLVGSDAVSKVTLTSDGAAASATVASPGPTYPVKASNPVFSTGDLKYYSPTYVDGTLTVNKANVNVTVNSYNVTYDGNPHTATGTVTGVNGQTPAGLDLSGTTHTNAGTYTADSWTFTDVSGNYNNTSGTTSDVISRATPNVMVSGYLVTYDGDPHTASGSATGAKGETLMGLDLSKTTHTPAGASKDPWTFTDSTGNYNNASGTVTDTINKADPAIKVTPYTVTFDNKAHTATGSATGVKGESLSGLDLSGTTHTSPGSYTDTWTFTDSTGNYNNATAKVTDNIQYQTAGKTCAGDWGHQILQPVNADGTSTFKQGSTVPAKFRVCDAYGNSIGTPGVVAAFNLMSMASGTLTPTVDEAIVSTTPDTAFRWDPTAQQWIFNISTKNLKAQTTYYYRITLNDGTFIDFRYGLPK